MGKYGSKTAKKLYVYGTLNNEPMTFRPIQMGGFNWAMAGFLFEESKVTDEMKERVAREVKTTFATTYGQRLSLEEMVHIEKIQEYQTPKSNAKALVMPQVKAGVTPSGMDAEKENKPVKHPVSLEKKAEKPKWQGSRNSLAPNDYSKLESKFGALVCCEILDEKVNVYSEQSEFAPVITTFKRSDIICIRNDAESPDPKTGWLSIFQWDGFIHNAKLDILPYGAHEATTILCRLLERDILQVETNLVQRIKKTTQGRIVWQQAVGLPSGIYPGDKSGKGSALCHSGFNGVCVKVSQAKPTNAHFLRATRPIRAGNLVEACRIVELHDEPGETLLPHVIKLTEDGQLGFPLGYAALYLKASDTLPLEVAWCEGTVARWEHGGFALLVHAQTNIMPGAILAMHHINGPASNIPRPLPPQRQFSCTLGAETSGMVNWARSSTCSEGVGVTALGTIQKDSVIEVCPALFLDEASLRAVSHCAMTFSPRLGDSMTFSPSLGDTSGHRAHCGLLDNLFGYRVLPLGCGALYGDAPAASCCADAWYDVTMNVVVFVARSEIKKGLEICVDKDPDIKGVV
jgi:hypothetical protein